MDFTQLMKKKKGVAGLNVYLGIVASVFVIGIIVMAFQLMGAKLMDATTDAGAKQVINETMIATGDTTDWFSIFIIVGAMVVLILLIVMIIVSLRGAGLMGGGGA